MAAVHRIRRHTLDLHYQGIGDGARLRSDAADWQKEVWMPLLERVLDKYDPGGETVRIDRLDVDLAELAATEWQTAAGAEAAQKLEAALRQKLTASRKPASPNTDRELEAFLYYLHRGAVPWWAPSGLRSSPREWLTAWITATPERVLAAAMPSILSSRTARTRLAAELSEESFWKVATALSGKDEVVFWQTEYRRDTQLLKEAHQYPQEYPAAFRAAVLSAGLHSPDIRRARAHFREHLLEVLPADARQTLQAHLNTLQAHPNALISGEDVSSSLEKETVPGKPRETPSSTSDAPALPDEINEEGGEEVNHYINNGGLVLLAAFLPALFSQLRLVDGIKITDPGRAVALLQYAVTGTQDYHEWQSLLPKILCGLSTHHLIPTGSIVLSNEEKREADVLLQSVIEHWTVLKNTSPAGLRQSFLQREARVTQKEAAWRMLVQPAAHDILIQYLPWTISIIRLPWMPAPLFVDWE